MKTLIHKNLHNGLWAITQGGRVVGYCDGCELEQWDTKEDAKWASCCCPMWWGFHRTGEKIP